MSNVKRLGKAVQGALWLIRGGGLRHSLHLLEENFQQVRSRINENSRDERRLSELEKWRRAGDLRAFESKVFSQNGEDGMIQEVFHRIGTDTKYFVEFGAQRGDECNCGRLVVQEKWSGLFIEVDPVDFEKLSLRYRDHPQVQCANLFVAAANIEAIFAAHQVPRNFDLLSIDIDGNDYWVWAAIKDWRPRLVVIEYNATIPPNKKWVMKEDLDQKLDGTNHFGASLASLTALARKKGYTLVATDSRGVNAFFVRDDLVTEDKFLDPEIHYHYSPLNHPLCPYGVVSKSGPYLEI